MTAIYTCFCTKGLRIYRRLWAFCICISVCMANFCEIVSSWPGFTSLAMGSGGLEPEGEPVRGRLRALLSALGVPASSQTLVPTGSPTRPVGWRHGTWARRPQKQKQRTRKKTYKESTKRTKEILFFEEDKNTLYAI